MDYFYPLKPAIFCSGLIYTKNKLYTCGNVKGCSPVGGGLAFSLCLLRLIVHSKLNHLGGEISHHATTH